MRVKVNDIQLNYELFGQADAAVVMLSHSLGSSLVMWHPQIKILESNYRVLGFDTRGHGDSDTPDGAYTLDQLGSDAIGLLDELGLDGVHFVGLSMGGMIGQWLALNHPHRLKSLTLCDTAAILPQETQPVLQDNITKAHDQGMQALVRSTLERWFTAPYLNQNPPGVQLIRQQFLNTSVTGYIGCSQAILGLNFLERLSEIKTPTMIFVGEEDPGTPVAAAQAMHQHIPNSKLVVLPSAAHLSNVEQAEIFNKTLLEFLQQHR
jgi:3-oxoadipate enol-lactonase